ncbi:MAG: class I SAM-dependent methyltransferase [Ramlibacter sp.]|nr:class I SAM-dependent methyltransferase [Ramlibacter sp.]
MADIDKVFAGSIPKLYESHLVPLIFQHYANDIAQRLQARKLVRVLEIAAGTGVVTRAMASTLSPAVEIVATDLNQAMLDEGAAQGTVRPVQWRKADAMDLPFEDGAFDAVVCQFGAMFFPDRAVAYAQARRVLKDGGLFLFNVWDRIEENEFADEVTLALETVFAKDPPRFLARTPHGYSDKETITRDLVQGGFAKPVRIETLAARSRATSARVAAIAYCQGTPLRSEIESRDANRLAEATDVATVAITRRFGEGEVDGKIQAHVVMVER